MADQIVTNEVPSTNTQFFAIFRLYETLLAAGWTCVDSSLGTGDTPDSTDHWDGAFGSLTDNAWIVLEADSGQQIVFRKNGSSTTQGFLLWLKDGGYDVANRSATRPGDLPATSAWVRGSGTLPGTYSSGASWFGSGSNTVATLNIGARDASGTGDESFWVVAQVPGQAYTSGTATAVHRIALEKLAHMSGLGIEDATPYAWLCPHSPTADWNAALSTLQSLLTQDAASDNTSGQWKRWWNAGQGGEAFKNYASGSNYSGYGFGAQGQGEDPNFDPSFGSNSDEVIYQATPVQLLRRIRLTKVAQVGFEDPEGGFTQNLFFASDAVASLDTMNDGTYAKFGNWLVVWWDGNPSNPPVEN